MEKTEHKYFWVIQFIGWGLLGSVNLIIRHLFVGVTPLKLDIFNFIGSCIGGLIVSSCFRFFCLKKITWITWGKGKLTLFIFISVLSLSAIWLFLLCIAYVLFFSKMLIFKELLANYFNLSLITLIWCLLYFGYNLIKHYHLSEVERWKLKSEVHKAQLDILKLQINPHFLFNTLNNIRALILEDKDRARQMLTNFSDLFRYSLQNSDRKEVLLSEELGIVNDFLELEKIQYEEKLEYETIVDEGLENEHIPPMVIQILVENAIKHGIALSSEKKNFIFITIRKMESTLIIRIKNTGTLDNKNKLESSQGLGIKNIKERLLLLYDGNATFDLKNEQQFVVATIQITK